MTEKTLREIALDAIPQELRESVLTYAAEQGITHANDPFWPVVASMANGMAAAKAAGEAADRTREETQKIPDMVYKGAISAGSDLKSQVVQAGQSIIDAAQTRAEALQEKVDAAIAKAAAAGSAVLKKAVAGLGAAAEKRKDELTQEMQAAAAKAAEVQIRAGLADRMARSWGVVAASLLIAMILGGGIALVGARMTGHLTPEGNRIATLSNGAPDCGPLGRGVVCVMQQP